jgi:hypothetical protein
MVGDFMSGPTVVNRHHVKGSHPEGSFYIGRRGRIAFEEIARGCDDATALGNPRRDRTEGNLRAYRRWLWDALRQGHSGVLSAFDRITEASFLVCSCAPRACHGDIVAKAWRAWAKAGKPRRWTVA